MTRSDRKQMIHVSRIDFRRNRDGRVFEQRSIPRGKRAPLVRARAQPREPHAQDGRLHLVEPAVDPDFYVMIAIALPAVPQTRNTSGERRVACHDRAAIAERAEILRGIEAECPCGAESADRLTSACREMRLAAVLDEGEILAAGEGSEGRHI